ncbi:hypothetical protein I2I11_09570 [Pontibacter sp. 172403-2]|uniref:hypothetical protein n=1 Tax=Pontibacter rufus TaxID=2791028 RepID=UPI0018AF91F6|nr:hypothetical protein [Pontibacter sp. 172403-2]MBF9253540.1 hypothetical protein [Pontibacter sp. 172403-2]
MRFSIRLLLLFVLCTLAGTALQAQPSRDTFGKSRIQYKNFDWKLYSTQNFNIYFSQGGQEIAQNAAAYAEQELKRVTSLIGYYPYAKVTLILYNSPTDLKQSNIGIDNDQFQTGGETLFMKNKVEIAFPGTQTGFKHELSYKLTELLLNDMMYGGSLKEALQSSYLLRLPDWFIGGVAAYTAEGWSLEMDNYMRSMLLQEPDLKPEKLLAQSPQLAGQSIWNYIAERYGYTAIQNILNLTRITRDVEIGITSSLNIPYKRFLNDWYNYYKQINNRSDNPLVLMPESAKLFKTNKKDLRYTEPMLNPAGTMLAYVENENGIYRIVVQDVRTKRDHIAWQGGYRTLDQAVDYTMPVLAWRNNSQIGFVEAQRGQMVLRQINAKRRRARIPFLDDLRTSAAVLDQFVQVHDISYSEDGQSLVVSAVRNGQSDLFLLRANGRSMQQLTNDIYDDIQPVFLKGREGIVFSSNRWIDSTGQTTSPGFNAVVNNYDIFLLPQVSKQVELQQLTSSIAGEYSPRAQQDGNLVYLSEQNGIRSLYRYNMASGTSSPLTNFEQSIKQYDYNSATNTLAYVAPDRARDFVYLLPAFTPTTLATLPKTSRQIILETRARVPQQGAATRKLLENETNSKKPKREGEVDIENYQFEDNGQAQQDENKKAPASPVRRAGSTDGNLQLSGPIDYDLRFSVQEIVTSVYADPQLGFGVVAGVNMSDLFENHQLRGSAFLRSNLKTSRLSAEYMNLKNRVDLGMQFHRDVIVTEENETGAVLRFGRNEFAPVLVYPLSYSTSIHVRPMFVNTRFTFINSFATPDSVTNFGGGNVEFVFDNTITTGGNMMQGTRMKAGLLSLKSFGSSAGDFSKFYIDLRHYQKLHRQIVLATRLSYGSFFGNSPKRFLIGGMDNWLIANDADATDENNINVVSPADLFYLEYVTPLRGFNFNTRNGSKYLLANAELRVPIVQYIYNGPVPSGFFRNLQLTAFADAGSAYNGSNPFTGRNSINTRIIGGRTSPTEKDPFEITVVNYRNPFLLGYGVGARTTLLGVYGKLDVAWGQEDSEQKGPKFYITLGYDF